MAAICLGLHVLVENPGYCLPKCQWASMECDLDMELSIKNVLARECLDLFMSTLRNINIM